VPKLALGFKDQAQINGAGVSSGYSQPGHHAVDTFVRFRVRLEPIFCFLTLFIQHLRFHPDTFGGMTMTGQRIGYKHVSTVDQNTGRQLEGVPVDKIFEDKASGKNTARPQLQAALGFCREGDTLVVHSMDRLARNLTDLRILVKDLTNRGVVVQFVKESLTFTGEDSPMANLLLSMLGAVAEFERALILERQREGIALAKAEGKYHGRKPILSADKIAEIRQPTSAGGLKKQCRRSHPKQQSSVNRRPSPGGFSF